MARRSPSLLVLLLLLLITGGLHAQSSWVPGEVLVRLKQASDTALVGAQWQQQAPQGPVLQHIVLLGEGSRYAELRFSGVVPSGEPELERLVATLPAVESTSLNYLVQRRAQPNDPQYASQWHLSDMNVEPVWNTTTGGTTATGQRIAVGIVDSGVEQNHPDLAANVVFAGSAADEHGTQVAGVVGAVGNNSTGVSGVNWDVDLVSPANVTTLSDAFEQFQFCLNQRTQFNQSNGVQGRLIVALTASWGIPNVQCGFGDPLFDDLGAAGILVVTAGPNDPTDIDVVADYPATCPNANNIVVTSYGQQDQVPFAVGDNTVHLLAPGLGIPTTDFGGGYATIDGNSFAIPNVAGAIALLYSNDCVTFAQGITTTPAATAQLVKQAILTGVSPFPGGNAITITGGKLNVFGAYQDLAAQCVPCSEVTVSLTTPAGADAKYLLVDGLGVPQAQGTGNTYSFCVQDGCYSGIVLDADSLAVNGSFTVTDGVTIITSGTIVNGEMTFTIGSPVQGCTNPAALNYDPNADCDDGSCCTEGVVQVAILTDELGLTGTIDVTVTLAGTVIHDGPLPVADLPGYGVSGVAVTFCEAPGCLSVTVGASDVPLADISLVRIIDQQDFQQEGFNTLTGFLGPVGELVEACDGVDNDCDGAVDEDFFWYPDADGDGWGANVPELVSCTPVPGSVTVTGDCDDADDEINPGMPDGCDSADGIDNNCNGQAEDDAGIWFTDADGDGWGNAGAFVLACVQPTGTSHLDGDCDDANDAVFPGANEDCDGLDNDCDGETDEGSVWYTDADGDGLGDTSTAQVSCTPPPGTVQTPGDCDDTDPALRGGITLAVLTENPEEGGTAHYVITQGATIIQGDLDMPVEAEGVGELDVCMADGCFSVVITPNDVPLFSESFVRLLPGGEFIPFPTATGYFGSVGTPDLEVCDGLDNDCDGEADEDFFWYVDADGDGFGDASTAQLSCTPIPERVQVAGDCNDADPNLTTVGATCDDGDPNTVNDIVRPDCSCLGFQPGECPPGEIADCNGNCAPAEWLGDGVCDDGSFEYNGVLIFFNCPEFGNDGGDCGEPCTEEVCDGVDNDCDGLVDEDVGTFYFPDVDQDGFGDDNAMVLSCTPLPGYLTFGGDCDDTDADVNPNATEVCNGQDDDCNGQIDEVGDSDGDGVEDCIDPCPLLAFVIPGDACDDGEPSTINDVITTACVCAGQPLVVCTTDLVLEFDTDANAFQITWELRASGSGILVQSGGGLPGPVNSLTVNTCLPDGCYYLRVLDAGGDGIANGGYILRTLTGAQRIIDNRDNFSTGSVSAVIGNGGFCLPLGTDRLIFTSCDKLDWVNNQFIVASENSAVSAQFGVGDQTDDGYQFWWFDPNGSYGYSKFRSHATSDGFGTGATRACHARINNWSPNQIPQMVLMNVKVRSRVNGVNSNWGPVCRFKIDPTRAACPLTKLMDIPGNVNFSCGVTRPWGSGAASKVVAKPVEGATQYQFRFVNGEIPGGVVRTTTTPSLQLNWTPALDNGTYEVQVRAYKNGAWCETSLPWGDVCNVTITGSPNAMVLDGGSTTSTGEVKLNLFPNPNNGEQLTVSLSAVEAGVETISVDIFDLNGARVSAQVLAVNDGMVYQMVDVAGLADGLYMVNITAGSQRYTERLVIAK